jgi:hypothetical protein
MDVHQKKVRAAQVLAACLLLLLSACRDRHEPNKPTVRPVHAELAARAA